MSKAEDLFWDCAAVSYNQAGVEESTMFGFRCIRVDGQFVAMPANDSLWVKLPAARVDELIDGDAGEECRPNGRLFREWVAVKTLDEELWRKLLDESIEFVRP